MAERNDQDSKCISASACRSDFQSRLLSLIDYLPAIKLVRDLQKRAVSKITETETERTTYLEDSMDELVGVGFIIVLPQAMDLELQLCDQLFYLEFGKESSSTRDMMVPLEDR